MTLLNSKEALKAQLEAIYCFCPDYKRGYFNQGKGTEVLDLKYKILVCMHCEKPHNSKHQYLQSCNDCGCWYWGQPHTLACDERFNNCIVNYDVVIPKKRKLRRKRTW